MFHLSTKSRYGLRSLIELAIMSRENPVSISSLAQNQFISKKYLENIFRLLQHKGIVRSVRGAHGGYQMAVSPSSLTVYDIIKAIDGPIKLIECIQHEDACDNSTRCRTRTFWSDLEDYIISFLKSHTLQSLIDKVKKVFL